MRIGVLDILALPAQTRGQRIYCELMTRQYASVTPQAISVWCRRAGHETFYATYYGAGDPSRSLPEDLDYLFVACHTHASPLAYAISRWYRQRGTVTVLGGPHARSFPADCLRWFDLAVWDCDHHLITRIVAGDFAPGSLVASSDTKIDFPSVAERMPEIRASAFDRRGRPFFATTIPLLASVGCPFKCSFCTDWDNPYRLLPLDRLDADMDFLAEHLPGTRVAFHDPNFGVKFDQVLDVLERRPRERCAPYIMECSLTTLRGERAARLERTRCVTIAPGIESWEEYSAKAGVGRHKGEEKVRRLIEQMLQIGRHVPYIQANFIFGLDSDGGAAPFELTGVFANATPHVWPTVNLPIPFGGTPMFDALRAEGRILEAMPFLFYSVPYSVLIYAHYSPEELYRRAINLLEQCCRPSLTARRLLRGHHLARVVHAVRTIGRRGEILAYRRIHRMLLDDRQFRAFHEGSDTRLPEFYQQIFDARLGRWAELIPRDQRAPLLDPIAPEIVSAPAA